MRASTCCSVSKPPSETRRIDSNTHAGRRDTSQGRTSRLIANHRISKTTSITNGARDGRVRCATSHNVFFIHQADHAVYGSMEAEEVDVDFLWGRLRPHLHHLDVLERRRICVALFFANEAHDGQFRKSGEPFITHPVEVARVLAGLRLDADAIISGLLHDTIEDTDRISLEEINRRFGPCVRRIVKALTRMTKVAPTDSKDSVEDLEFQHFFTYMSQDIRIILVKLADRLHNMRTMASMKAHKQREKASETIQVYAPLADVLGLDRIKEELEELSLRYLDPERYHEVKQLLKRLERRERIALEEAKRRLTEYLKSDPVLEPYRLRITIRQKTVYNFYQLYKESGWQLDSSQELKQVAQLHVLIESSEPSTEITRLCYYVMGAIHLFWTPIPGKVKDCIATPKPTSWKGLKTSVWLSSNDRLVTPIDVLIQTSEMKLGAFTQASPGGLTEWVLSDENGIDDASLNEVNGVTDASYETKTAPLHVNGVKEADNDWNQLDQAQLWLEHLQKWQDEMGTFMSPKEYAACVRHDFLAPLVYVITPEHEVIPLPKGATVLDFAYHIHTDIGNRAIGAEVDGSRVSSDFILRNAQVVKILTKNRMISPEDLDVLDSRLPLLQTKSARRKLKTFLKTHTKERPITRQMSESGSKGSIWIRVICEDRKGILKDVSGVLTSHGLNIEQCSVHLKKFHSLMMECHVDITSSSRLVAQISMAIEAVDGCSDVVSGCTLPGTTSTTQA